MLEQAKRMRESGEYSKYIDRISPQTSMVRSLLLSFIVGGIVCCIGQLAADLYMLIPNMTQENAKAFSLITLIGLAIFFTGIGVYDDLARYSGAGTFLPITGFANSVASAAIEFKSEGMILGLGAKMLIVAGPVIINGIVWATVAGLVHAVIALF